MPRDIADPNQLVLSLADLQSAFRERWQASNALARRTVEEAHAAGTMLVEIKARLPHGEWLPWLEAEGIQDRTARRMMQIASLKSDKLSDLFTFDAALKSISDAPHVSHNSGENEWYTPSIFIEAARATMGGIDLDPASSEHAQRNVKAARYFTAEDDGLAQSWSGRIWMNPPYERQLVDAFITKLVSESVDQAVVLVNNATETDWGQTLFAACSAVCFPAKRVRFESPSGARGAPLQGQMIVYLGDNASLFREKFSGMGACFHA